MSRKPHQLTGVKATIIAAALAASNPAAFAEAAPSADTSEWPAITSALRSNAGRNIALDSVGNIYTVGEADVNLPVTQGAPYPKPTTSGAWSYVAKLDA